MWGDSLGGGGEGDDGSAWEAGPEYGAGGGQEPVAGVGGDVFVAGGAAAGADGVDFVVVEQGARGGAGEVGRRGEAGVFGGALWLRAEFERPGGQPVGGVFEQGNE